MPAPVPAGPIETTVLELEQIVRPSLFARRRLAPARAALRDSAALMSLIEEAQENHLSIAPTWLWSAVARIVSHVDSTLRDQLGIDRRPAHLAQILFAAQERLMLDAHRESHPRLATVIPLFG